MAKDRAKRKTRTSNSEASRDVEEAEDQSVERPTIGKSDGKSKIHRSRNVDSSKKNLSLDERDVTGDGSSDGFAEETNNITVNSQQIDVKGGSSFEEENSNKADESQGSNGDESSPDEATEKKRARDGSGQKFVQKFGDLSPAKNPRLKNRQDSSAKREASDQSSGSEQSVSVDRSPDESSSTDSDHQPFSIHRQIRQYDDDSSSDDKVTRNSKAKSRQVRRHEERMEAKAAKRKRPPNFTLVTGITPKLLTKTDHASVQEFANHMSALRSSGNFTSVYSLIDSNLRDFIGIKMAAHKIPDNPRKRWLSEDDLLAYRFWTDTKLLRRLLVLFPDEKENSADHNSVASRIKRVKVFVSKANKWLSMDNYQKTFMKILGEYDDVDDDFELQADLIKIILMAIKSRGSRGGARAHDLLSRGRKVKTVNSLFIKWQSIKEGLENAADEMDYWAEDDRRPRSSGAAEAHSSDSFPPTGGSGRESRGKERDRRNGNRSRRASSVDRDARHARTPERQGSTPASDRAM